MEKKHWIRLDNAAKIFPAAAKGSNTQVFRLSCELDVWVDPQILQQALNETVDAFPVYQYTLRRGLFWYYLENTALMPTVSEEHKPPCSPLYSKTKKSLLYEVSYYKNKVNLEVFHVLSDGTGAMHFFSTLISKYLARVQGIPEPVLAYDGSYTQMKDDSFSKYYSDKKYKKTDHQRNCCKLKGAKYAENRIKVITGTVPVDILRETARKYDATITAFLCTCLMYAISDTLPTRTKRKPIVISVPVNLRNVFPSSSLRNFFSVIKVECDFSAGSNEFSDIIAKVGRDLKEHLKAEELASNLNNFSAIEHNVFARIVPLPLKDILMEMAYLHSRKKVTAALSNIGVITMPPELKHLRGFDVLAGSDCLQTCVCSFQKRLSISFTSPFVSADIQQRFFRILTEMGIPVELTGNNLDDE